MVIAHFYKFNCYSGEGKGAATGQDQEGFPRRGLPQGFLGRRGKMFCSNFVCFFDNRLNTFL